jgi:hypothetical protein
MSHEDTKAQSFEIRFGPNLPIAINTPFIKEGVERIAV